MAEVLCLGEILVDWVCTTPGLELSEAAIFTKAAGGAPANVAVGLARQGVSAAFLGRVSSDKFGVWLKRLLEDEGIDTRNIVVDENSQTRMAYVVTTKSGDRKLAEFTKVNVADSRLCPSDLDESLFKHASILHFGSISLISEPACAATLAAVNLAKKNGLIVSYDPNVRLGLWPSPEVCKTTILRTLHYADIVKINVDELEFLTGSRDLASANRLREEHAVALMIVTLDSNGAFISTSSGSQTVPGFSVQLVEATGAGDGFVSGILCGVVERLAQGGEKRKILAELSLSDLVDLVSHANAVGALTCCKAGAIPALPTKSEVKSFLQELHDASRSCNPL